MIATVDSPSLEVFEREIARFAEAIRHRGWVDEETGRRRARRYHRSWPLLISTSTGNDEDVAAALHDASDLGVGFLADCPYRVGSTVLIKLFWHELACVAVPAVVKHSTPIDHGILTGCAFAIYDATACEATLAAQPRWYE